MNKKQLSERDICTQFITPAVVGAGWNLRKQVREEVSFTDGRIIVQGKLYARGKQKRADYILYYKPNIPLVIIEAKSNRRPVGDGMQQAVKYAEVLQVPFVFTSNGDSFVFKDMTAGTEREIALEDFPSPTELWQKYLADKGLEDDTVREIVELPYYTDTSGMSPRYYQQNAVNRTMEAISKGQDRILLVMATGTGKTYTAFNIVWRLWKSGVKKRILFLADRNALLTQTRNEDFSPFGTDIMHIIKNRKIDKSYQIYFALYQGLTSNDETKNAYKEFTPDFFDLVIIDECHRGSASEASAWRDVLDYFSNATQIGMTATPKETKDVSNMHYFGPPVYTYSLKQGIADGFLAPYKVVRVTTTVDDGWRPTQGLIDKYGQAVVDRIYNLKDYDRNLAIDERTQLVANRVTEFLKDTNRFDKTIVFCVDIDHANRMRMALINANADLAVEHPNYIVKITGDDEVGKGELDNFKDVEEPLPVIATTSKMLTTGINTKMVKLIVLDANIGSMTEFKQIIGRGSRIREPDGKVYFTIMDFRKATNLFADPDFDGDPVQIYEPGPNDPIVPPDITEEEGAAAGAVEGEGAEVDQLLRPYGLPPNVDILEDPEAPRKFYVNGVRVTIAHERVQYLSGEGKLITESLKDYTRQRVKDNFPTATDFIRHWNDADKKADLIADLADRGVLIEALREDVGQDLDPFDLICHIAYDQPPLTRKQRAGNVRQRNYFAKYGELAQEVIRKLLEKYEEEGIGPLEQGAVLTVRPINQLGSTMQLVRAFGKKKDFEAAIKELEGEIYHTG